MYMREKLPEESNNLARRMLHRLPYWRSYTRQLAPIFFHYTKTPSDILPRRKRLRQNLNVVIAANAANCIWFRVASYIRETKIIIANMPDLRHQQLLAYSGDVVVVLEVGVCRTKQSNERGGRQCGANGRVCLRDSLHHWDEWTPASLSWRPVPQRIRITQPYYSWMAL